MLKAVPQIGALTGCRFQQNTGLQARRGGVNFPQRPGYPRQPCLLTGFSVRAGMQYQVWDSQCLAPFQLDDEHVAGSCPQLVVWRGRVKQIGGMANYRMDAGLAGLHPEQGDFLVAQRAYRPGPAGLDENL